MLGKRVCAWCNQKLKGLTLVTASNTHGICTGCLLRVFGLTPAQLKAKTDEHKHIQKAVKAKKRALAAANRRRRRSRG